MDELNNAGNDLANEKSGLSVEEQIRQLESEINSKNNETQVVPSGPAPKCEPDDAKHNKCNTGTVFGICGLILGLAAILLFVLLFTGVISVKTPETEVKQEPTTIFDGPAPARDTSAIDVAYIDLDTLLLTYNYAIKLQEDLAMEQKKAEGTIQARMKKFESMYNAFAEKARTGMFLNQASQQAQQNELEKEQQAIENLQATLTNQLLEKQEQMNHEIYDTVINFINQYSDGRFKIILGNMGGVNVVYAQPGMNITADVVTKLNQRYGGILENDTKEK